jgi:cytochrome c-type biogenesis protein CcmH/NrfG
VQALERSKTIFAKSPQVELALGVAYYGQRRFAEAVDAFLRTIDIAPTLAQPYVFLARILTHAENRLDEVKERFAKLARANPENSTAQLLYAKALTAAADDRSAETLLRKVIALDEKNWEAQFELGVLLERAVELNPGASTPHYRLARVYDRLGKNKEAERARALHEKLAAEEKEAVRRRAGVASIERLELVIK